MQTETSTLTLTQAITFATVAHEGQEYGRFNGRPTPYIFHPMRVMTNVSKRAWIVAICHDLMEDCRVLPPGLSEVDAEAIRILTRSKSSETYEQYIQRIKNAPGEAGIIAREVKRADLNDNLDNDPPARLKERYHRALVQLGGF